MPPVTESPSSVPFDSVAIGSAWPTPFRCDVLPERGRVRVAPAGELDIATVSRVEQAIRDLLAVGFDDVLVDLTNVKFLDSTGLHLLLALHATAAAGGCRFRLRPGPPAVQRVFELTGTLERLDFEAPLPYARFGSPR